MDKSLLSRLISKIAIAIIALAAVDLVFLNWWVLQNQKSDTGRQTPEDRIVKTIGFEASTNSNVAASPTPLSSPEVETKSVETRTVVEKESQTIVQTAQKEIFIPIGSGSTFKNTYTDLAGLEVTVDTTKYSAIDSVVFEGSIWVQDGNGKTYAQLYNKTDSHPVWNSEISTSSSTGTLTSANISLDSGAKTYKVQAKTNLTSYAAHVENARIKITLK